MTDFTKGQKVQITAGTYAGRAAFFEKHNTRRAGKCFVQIAGRASYLGAHVNVADLVPA